MCCSSICMSAWLMLFPIVSCSMAAFRDKSINKWQRMTQVTTGAAAIKGKLYAFNQDISNQVAAYMRDPSRIIKQMQLRRSSVKILGSAAEVNNGSNEAVSLILHYCLGCCVVM
ncbi:hypothetical protein P8452_05702 [Trifolium repens]|nr:hypothetical protein P8452_05702 [Trifolium repens]